MKPTIKEAYQLLHEGTLALAKVEANGIRIDIDRLEATISKVSRYIDRLTEKLKDDEIWLKWRRRFGYKTNITSRTQLAKVVYGELGYESEKKTKLEKRESADETSLRKLKIPFVNRYLQLEKLKKLRATYLNGVKREVVDGFLHPSFNLNLVKTFRSSSDSPNFQNIPIRDKRVGKLIRQCFIPREGNVLLEIDFGALEVRIAACYHKDPAMLAYIKDPTKDMHRDAACDCYLLTQDRVTKDIRFYAKNQFVFPEFYGSYYAKCAPNLWNAIDTAKLVTSNGTPLKEHLAEQGIKRLGACKSGQEPKDGTFEKHIKEVETDFWENRFSVYAQWKDDWWNEYLKNGYFDLLTGFREVGVYKKNDVINHPVQGAAFHCLLWSLIQLQKWLTKSRLGAMIIGQIHDSILVDCPKEEIKKLISKAKCIMTGDIRNEWPWIIVPLEVEVEITETSWFEKEKYKE